jgi:hypothetical protein
MTKTPYEIRLDVLKMAKDMLEEENRVKMNNFNVEVSSLSETNIGAVSSFIAENKVVSYSTADILNKADELYKFVSTDSRIKK